MILSRATLKKCILVQTKNGGKDAPINMHWISQLSTGSDISSY